MSVVEFQFSRLERVISGADSIDHLSDELERRQLTRVVIVTGQTLAASALLHRLTRPLGDRCAAVFSGAKQHVPECSVTELARVVERHHADCVISFGGGSPIDTAKAAIHTVLTGNENTPAVHEGPVHIAVPTTLSAGEFTSVVGITDERTRVKRAVHDARLAPRTVYVDPTVTLDTPSWLWAASGVRALDHAVESMYSARHHPFSDAVAGRGLSLLVEHLLPSLEATSSARLEHRLHSHLGAWMAVFGMTNAGFGLSHALGHQIGPRWDVPHGITSCITLPHVMRFMAQRAADRFGPIAEALGVGFNEADSRVSALACAERIDAFIARLGVARRLRDVGVPADELGEVAGVVHGIMEGAHALDTPAAREEIEALLRAAY